MEAVKYKALWSSDTGDVSQIVPENETFEIAEGGSIQWVDCPDEVKDDDAVHFRYSPEKGWYRYRRPFEDGVGHPKMQRKITIANLKVTLKDGTVLKANKKSQDDMFRAFSLMTAKDSIDWKTASGETVSLTKAQLKEALQIAKDETTKAYNKEQEDYKVLKEKYGWTEEELQSSMSEIIE